MSTLLLRATSLLTAIGLTGTPAVLTACLALCAPGMVHAAADASETGLHAHAGHAPSVEVAHQGHQTTAPHAGPHGKASDADQSCYAGARWQGVADSCCVGATVMPATRVPAGRDAAGLSRLMAAVTVSRILDMAPSPASFSSVRPALSPPSPIRSPLVLRV